jgi:transposase
LTQAKLGSGPSSKSAYPLWITILSDGGEFPSFSRPQPIPFDVRNSSIIIPTTAKEDFRLRVRIEAFKEDHKKVKTAIEDEVILQTKGKKVAGQTAILEKVVSGDYKFCGSTITFRESTNEWFACICYKMPAQPKPTLDPGTTLVLSAGRKKLWLLRAHGRTQWAGGRTGRHVAHVRRQLLTQRWSRQDGYRYAGSARKGRGRQRALKGIEILTTRWKDFVKTANQQTVKHVIDRCIEARAGRVVYLQPSDQSSPSRFLSNAGKVEDRRDQSSWDWFQVGTMLKQKGQELGIEVIVKKARERRTAEGTAPKTKKSRRKLAKV